MDWRRSTRSTICRYKMKNTLVVIHKNIDGQAELNQVGVKQVEPVCDDFWYQWTVWAAEITPPMQTLLLLKEFRLIEVDPSKDLYEQGCNVLKLIENEDYAYRVELVIEELKANMAATLFSQSKKYRE